MNNYNYDDTILREYLANNNLKAAKEYLVITENFSTDEAINFLHKYINENNINLKKPKDIIIGYKNLVIILITMTIASVILTLLSFSTLRSIIDNSTSSSKILFLIILSIFLIVCIAYTIILILDITSKQTIVSSGYYRVPTIKSGSFQSNVLKFENGDVIITSHKVNEILKHYNYCTVTRFKYSKLIKNITNIK
ncbi:hypothetical protein [Miniphocaeibacter massiliensis]|uniref:hypothetical protein n=1 Tax=Miniphocaeibacter massiliensis TaxID=2041841 RepID=UPI000C1C1983|nr:hypothetical protein [Miniphocaeibacter massiliensis]